MKTTLLALVAVAAIGCGCKSIPDPVGVPGGEDSFSLLDGSSLTLASLQGKVVLVDFWHPDCEPCMEELVQHEQWAVAHAAEGLVVVAVDVDDAADRAGRLSKNLFPHALAAMDVNRVRDRLEIPGVPTSFVIRRDGVVSKGTVGFLPRSTAALEKAVGAALKND